MDNGYLTKQTNKTNESKKTIVYLGSLKYLSLQHSWILYSLPTLSQTNVRNSLVKNAIVYVEYPEDPEFESAKDEQGFVQLPPRGAPDRGPQVKEVLEV